MPGGQVEAWQALAPIFRAIAAKADDGEPCVEYMGPGGAGHFVKMVHNGIEYGDMQLIAETYDLLSRGLGLSAQELAGIFAEWNQGELKSYLVEITAEVLARVDPDTGRPLVDVILDEAQQKGTGKWTSQTALDVGAPIPTINAAVESRIISSFKAAARGGQQGAAGTGARLHRRSPAVDRRRARRALRQQDHVLRAGPRPAAHGVRRVPVRPQARPTSRGSGGPAASSGRRCSATSWRRSSAIRSLVNLLVDPAFADAIHRRQASWRFVVQTAVGLGVPMPATCASLAYFDAYRSERLPANLTQGQRDYFGAHTYRRVDKARRLPHEW